MSDSAGEPDKGRLYYLRHNLQQYFSEKLHTLLRSKWFYAVCAALLIFIVLFRPLFHPLFMTLRHNSFVGLLLLLLIAVYVLMKKLKLRRIIMYPSIIGLLAVMTVFVSYGGQSYLAYYFKYNSLHKVELSQLPVTALETPQPLNSVHVLANEIISETDSVSTPDRILVDQDLKWVMEVAPTYTTGKLFGDIHALFAVSATTPSPDFSKRETVEFALGESLLLGKNSHNAVIKRFGLFKYLSYYPADVRYLKDDNGEWVQVVSLAKWDGILFPALEFGGIYVLKQHEDKGFFAGIRRFFIGSGTYIAPEDIANYPFLKGQNLLPFEVSRYIAESFRFQAGFLGPMPGLNHKGDIRIPDAKEDLNKQPFTLYFEQMDQQQTGLFHYFGLEPYTASRHGLNTSVFIPGDGRSDAVYIYQHAARKEALTGASAISSKVIESRKNYDWSKSRPVEVRPFIKDIHGKRRFYWLSTVALVNQEGNMAGSVPDLVITDARYARPVWVNVLKGADDWVNQLSGELEALYNKE